MKENDRINTPPDQRRCRIVHYESPCDVCETPTDRTIWHGPDPDHDWMHLCQDCDPNTLRDRILPPPSSNFWIQASYVFFVGMVASFALLLTQVRDDSSLIVGISGVSLLACGLGATYCSQFAVEAKEREEA